MRAKTVLGSALLLAALIPRTSSATGIQDLPGLVGALVCTVSVPLLVCGGASQTELATPPHSGLAYLADGHVASVGLSDAEGSFESGGEFLTVHLLGSPESPIVWLDSVSLQFDSDSPARFLVPSSVVALADLVFADGYGPADLDRLLEPFPEPNRPFRPGPIGIRTGALVFGFASVPEPRTAASMAAGFALLGVARRRRRTR